MNTVYQNVKTLPVFEELFDNLLWLSYGEVVYYRVVENLVSNGVDKWLAKEFADASHPAKFQYNVFNNPIFARAFVSYLIYGDEGLKTAGGEHFPWLNGLVKEVSKQLREVEK